MAIVARSRLEDLERKEDFSDYRVSRDCYCKKRHPTKWMVKLPSDKPLYKNRWRRVFSCCYSNVATHYVEVPGGWHVIDM